MDLRYPIGQYSMKEEVSDKHLARFIEDIAAVPVRLSEVVSKLSDEQLDTPYRPGGWSVRQVVHHLADSHMNAYVRWRLALTETEPTIKPYEEALWAELSGCSPISHRAFSQAASKLCTSAGCCCFVLFQRQSSLEHFVILIWA
ncbi:MAG: DinB family protein [Pyrinomonadaceae bacterium]